MTRDDGPGRKDDAESGHEKAPVELLPWGALHEVALVMGFGRDKYPHEEHKFGTWRGLARTRLWAAAVRHLYAWLRGENADPETGRSHLAHAAACVLMVLEQEQDGWGTDDRPPM